MAFKASNIVPSDAYITVKRAAVQLKTNLTAASSFIASNNIDYEYLRGLYRTLERAKNQFNALSVTPGLADYAKAQENDQAYNVATEFTAMVSAINTALTWMNNNIPTSVTVKTPDQWGDTTIITNTFTPAQTATLRTGLNAIVATIE